MCPASNSLERRSLGGDTETRPPIERRAASLDPPEQHPSAHAAPRGVCAEPATLQAVRGADRDHTAGPSQSLHGYGLRVCHYPELFDDGPRSSLVEGITENFIGRGGTARALLRRVRADAEVALHGVSLSVGALDPLNQDYLRALDELQREIEPRSISDHLCFGTFGGHYGHDLWPLPYTPEALTHVAERVARVQERLGRRILLENVSSYVEYRASVMPEWEFLKEVVERADALILLDVNNVIVSAKNHGFAPEQYIAALPAARVAQLHLAGHSDYGTHAIDDHGSAVPEEVWQLYETVVERMGSIPAIVEWDDNVPPLPELQRQSQLAREREQRALARIAARAGRSAHELG